MEFDCYQPYFLDLDTGEDFYKSTAPSEDIWKKFELLSTPPTSPTRTLGGEAVAVSHFSPGDQLGWLSRVLGQEDEWEGQFVPDTGELFGNLSSIIIRDCMWSSFSATKQLEKVNERLSGAQGRPPAPQTPARPCKTQDAALIAASTDCVDPAAVLTFPASGVRKPASSGSESRSDSSDDDDDNDGDEDDDDDDDDDDEEIDVVTVESKRKRGQLSRSREPETLTVRADPCPKRFHMSVHRQQHNYAARSPDSGLEEDEDEDEEPETKRVCLESVSWDTPQSSDGEDTDRRKNHNFLERQRRNDLRSRFMSLRDQIPGLVESTKTPKVAILTQATDYLVQLHSREKQHVQEKKRLKSRQQQLLRRLAELKRS